jgi:hypothetical protein
VKGPKTHLLVNDLARLVLKYSLADWLPVLEEIAAGGVARKRLRDVVFELVREVHEVPPKRRVARKSTAKRNVPARPRRSFFATEAARVIDDREVVPTLGHLRELAFALGMKAALPSSRDRATDTVVDYLDTLPEHQQELTTELLRRLKNTKRQDARRDYQRWFSVILSNSSGSGS